MRSIALALAAAVSGAAACGGGAAPGGAAPAPRGPANLITEAEIQATSYSTALEIVQGLRPTMLRNRSTTMNPATSRVGFPDEAAAGGEVVAYVDDVRLGDATMLGTIPVSRVKEIRYIGATDATTRWGTGHGSGAILVVTRRP
jgi:hypothetical protein